MIIDDGWKRVGLRIAHWRVLAGMTQEQLADAIGVSQEYVSMIENGRRIITKRPLLFKIAAALGVSVNDLTGQPVPARDADDWATFGGAELVRTALFMPEQTGSLTPLEDLGQVGDLVLRHWMHVDYGALGQSLPNLLTQATIWHEQRGDERALDLILRGCVAGSLAYRPVGWLSLSLALAQRATWAAERLGDPAAEGAARYVTAQCAHAAGKPQRSLDLATLGAATLDGASGADARTWSVMLHLQAALSAANLGLPGDSERHLGAAAAHAEEAAFGTWSRMEPTRANVALWRSDIAWENGNQGEVAVLARQVDEEELGPPQRRARKFLNIGRGLFHAGDHPGAVRALLRADDIASATIRNRPEVREITLAIVQAAPVRQTGSPQLSDLSQRVGVAPSIDV